MLRDRYVGAGSIAAPTLDAWGAVDDHPSACCNRQTSDVRQEIISLRSALLIPIQPEVSLCAFPISHGV